MKRGEPGQRRGWAMPFGTFAQALRYLQHANEVRLMQQRQNVRSIIQVTYELVSRRTGRGAGQAYSAVVHGYAMVRLVISRVTKKRTMDTARLVLRLPQPRTSGASQ